MNIKEFWNDAAKWGLFIGVVMGVSKVFEYSLSMSGELSKFSLYTIEWVFVASIYSVMMFRAVNSRAHNIYSSFGFSFGHLLNYAMIISAFASIIVSMVSYIYINSVVGGYTIYMERFITSVTSVFEQAEVDSSMMEMYRSAFENMESSENIPTMFDTVISNMSIYIIAGVLVGVIVTLIVKRRLKKTFEDGTKS